MTHQCEFGGDAELQSFGLPGKPLEWFQRCWSCNRRTRTVASPEEAMSLTIESDPALEPGE